MQITEADFHRPDPISVIQPTAGLLILISAILFRRQSILPKLMCQKCQN